MTRLFLFNPVIPIRTICEVVSTEAISLYFCFGCHTEKNEGLTFAIAMHPQQGKRQSHTLNVFANQPKIGACPEPSEKVRVGNRFFCLAFSFNGFPIHKKAVYPGLHLGNLIILNFIGNLQFAGFAFHIKFIVHRMIFGIPDYFAIQGNHYIARKGMNHFQFVGFVHFESVIVNSHARSLFGSGGLIADLNYSKVLGLVLNKSIER
jgi:hypothetical protein